MNPDPTHDAADRQDEETFLVTSDYQSLSRWLNCCPAAATLSAYSLTLGTGILLQTRCKRWNCPHCGPRRIAHITRKIVAAKPNKLITLTLRTTDFASPRDAYDRSRRKVSKLVQRIRKAFGAFEYLRVLEATKKGWPHYHIVARSGYVPQTWLSEAWHSLTGAHIVDIRPLKNAEHTARYVMKYLYKQKHVQFTERRLTWSKQFFAKDEDEKPESLQLEDRLIIPTDPAHEFFYHAQGRTLRRIGPDVWEIVS